MNRPLILGTAGHIDHGKTSLIRALSGIDPDRLPEEQQRGMTIDIGFAHIEIEGRRIGIVDVPGHERFIRNMVAGATGIDFVMLVVAADDGVMPQTREHLEIIDLLGVPGGLVALNKCDLAEPQRLESVESEIRSAVRGTCLEDAPVVRISAATGEGLANLRVVIGQVIQSLRFQPWPPLFRLPIDRRFTLKGHGTVVTGSLMGGDVKAADEVELLPRGKRVRVRSVQSHGGNRRGVESGRRVALNLPGVKVRELERGMELAAPGFLCPSRRLAVHVRCLSSAPMEIEPRHEQRLHIGTMDVAATFSFIRKPLLEPGESCFAIMQTDRPVCAAWGQRFVIRSPGHGVTIGGGQILLTSPPRVRLSHDPPAWIVTMKEGPPRERILTALEIDPLLGMNLNAVYRETGTEPQESAAILQSLADEGWIRQAPGRKAAGFWPKEYVEECKRQVLKSLREQLEANRPRRFIPPGAFLKSLSSLGSEEFLQGLLEELSTEGAVRLAPGRVELSDYAPSLSAAEQRDLERLLSVYRESGLAPDPLEAMAARAKLSPVQAEVLHQFAVETGQLIFIAPDQSIHAEIHRRMLDEIAAAFAGANALTVSQIKERLSISRKYAVPLCEYLDRRGYTVRAGDTRRPGPELSAAVPAQG